MTADLVVVALGNPYRRDDGVGPALVARLQDRDLPPVDCIDLGDAGFDLVHVAADYAAIVIVDAVDFGGGAGEFAVFDPEAAEERRERHGSHGTDPLELLEMAGRLAGTSPKVRVFGVQPAETGLGESFSPAVARRLSGLTDALVETVRASR